MQAKNTSIGIVAMFELSRLFSHRLIVDTDGMAAIATTSNGSLLTMFSSFFNCSILNF